LTTKFQSDEQNYLNSFRPIKDIPVIGMEFYDGCQIAGNCDLFNFTVFINCTTGVSVCGSDPTTWEPWGPWQVVPFTWLFNDPTSMNETAWEYFAPLLLYNMGPKTSEPPTVLSDGWASSRNPSDFRVVFFPECEGWCSNTKWMKGLCIAIACVCVGFSGIVFLYLYTGVILQKLYPRRLEDRLAALIALAQAEEAPNLDRPNTSSKSESIRPDLKEY